MNTKQKILILEDDILTQQVYSAIFSKAGEFDLIFCKNDIEFYKVLDMHRIDLFLIDLALGTGKDGIEIIRDLRGMVNYKTAPIIVVTAYALMKDEHEALNAGATMFIRKPFINSELKAQVMSLIDHSIS